ncbi:hypothetical protein DRE_05195 [Drechslerella stenobrocha 248]|uniref:Uncharacterized protein n=1 Tax=Drechslerella stenobrocha 248 TaxID=1043628 RepID=W7HR26_9PEZI|nr:hypothetical protein DRE_05195 [Drechslerella stenobrocha 248]
MDTPPRRPDLRYIVRTSRLLDKAVHIDPAVPKFTSRLLAAPGLRKWWREAIVKYWPGSDRRTRRPVFGQHSRRNGAKAVTLFDLPNELISLIIDQPILSDLDRLRFGSTCALIMANTLPVLYKYALLRYPVQNSEMNKNLMLVGHLVRELIIHIPANAAPIFDEDKYLPPYDILNKMTALRSVTIYLDAPMNVVEVTAVLKYLLKTKALLTHFYLDIDALSTSVPSYEPRSIYELTAAVEASRPPMDACGDSPPPPLPQLRELSIAVRDCSVANAYLCGEINRAFEGHCDRLQTLRALPRLHYGNEADLAMFRSPAVEQITYPVVHPFDDLYRPGFRATRRPERVTILHIYAFEDAKAVLDKLWLDELILELVGAAQILGGYHY